MSTDPYFSINGARANTGKLLVPLAGRWVVDAALDGTTPPTGAVTVKIGSLSLVGFIDPTLAGGFISKSVVRVVGGFGGWSTSVSMLASHNDALVKRADVITKLATACGETVDTAGDSSRLAPDFVPIAGPAARVLESILGSTPWRVDFDGVTRYGARPAASLASDAELLDVDPLCRVFTFAANDPSSIPIGAVVTDPRVSYALTICQIEAQFDAASSRIIAWGISS